MCISRYAFTITKYMYMTVNNVTISKSFTSLFLNTREKNELILRWHSPNCVVPAQWVKFKDDYVKCEWKKIKEIENKDESIHK